MNSFFFIKSSAAALATVTLAGCHMVPAAPSPAPTPAQAPVAQAPTTAPTSAPTTPPTTAPTPRPEQQDQIAKLLNQAIERRRISTLRCSRGMSSALGHNAAGIATVSCNVDGARAVRSTELREGGVIVIQPATLGGGIHTPMSVVAFMPDTTNVCRAEYDIWPYAIHSPLGDIIQADIAQRRKGVHFYVDGQEVTPTPLQETACGLRTDRVLGKTALFEAIVPHDELMPCYSQLGNPLFKADGAPACTNI